MAIPAYALANFETLLKAARADDLALLECSDAATGETRFVLCAVARDGHGFVMTPLGHLATGDPYAAYLPPA